MLTTSNIFSSLACSRSRLRSVQRTVLAAEGDFAKVAAVAGQVLQSKQVEQRLNEAYSTLMRRAQTASASPASASPSPSLSPSNSPSASSPLSSSSPACAAHPRQHQLLDDAQLKAAHAANPGLRTSVFHLKLIMTALQEIEGGGGSVSCVRCGGGGDESASPACSWLVAGDKHGKAIEAMMEVLRHLMFECESGGADGSSSSTLASGTSAAARSADHVRDLLKHYMACAHDGCAMCQALRWEGGGLDAAAGAGYYPTVPGRLRHALHRQEEMRMQRELEEQQQQQQQLQGTASSSSSSSSSPAQLAGMVAAAAATGATKGDGEVKRLRDELAANARAHAQALAEKERELEAMRLMLAVHIGGEQQQQQQQQRRRQQQQQRVQKKEEAAASALASMVVKRRCESSSEEEDAASYVADSLRLRSAPPLRATSSMFNVSAAGAGTVHPAASDPIAIERPGSKKLRLLGRRGDDDDDDPMEPSAAAGGRPRSLPLKLSGRNALRLPTQHPLSSSLPPRASSADDSLSSAARAALGELAKALKA